MIATLVGTIVTIALLAFALWLYIVLPYQMAARRRRSEFGWVLVSLIFSPLLAIALLWLLGDRS